MGCCGQTRSQPLGTMAAGQRLAWSVPTERGLDPPTVTAGVGVSQWMRGPLAEIRGLRLRYRERVRMLVHGPVTGRAYEFSAVQPTQLVERRDAEELLRTRYFTRA